MPKEGPYSNLSIDQCVDFFKHINDYDVDLDNGYREKMGNQANILVKLLS
jgi:hypothetical protein